jgi:hypothetical protein
MSLLGAGLSTFGQIYGANKIADSSAEAAQIQQQEFDKALAAQQAELDYQHGLDTYKQQQYGSYLSRLQPYLNTGEQANASLSQWMAQPGASGGVTASPATTAALRQPPPSTAPQQPTTPAQSAQPTASATGMVTMQAPDGSTKDVPASQVAYWTSKGATPVNRFRPEGQV